MFHLSYLNLLASLIIKLLLLSATSTAITTIHVGSNCTFKTLHSARDHLRSLQSDAVTNIVSSIVYIHQGTYLPLVLDSVLDDNTIWTGYNSDSETPPIISAGTPLPAALWHPQAKDTNGNTIYVTDFKKLNLSYGGGLPQNGGAIQICDQRTLQKTQLTHGNAEMQPQLARYPNADGNSWKFLHAVKPFIEKNTTIGFVPSPADKHRVQNWVQFEEAPFVHGYWAWDWADSIAAIVSNNNSNNGSSQGIAWAVGSQGPQVKKNARYFGLNLLSELDIPGEYFISNKTGLIHYLPINAQAPSTWTEDPVLSTNTSCITLDHRKNVTIQNMIVAHSTSIGISAANVTNAVFHNLNVFGHGAIGINLSGTNSTISNSNVTDIGCKSVAITCGDMYTMTSGHCVVKENRLTRFAQYKRTYQPGLHWAGVDNLFTHNHISNGPHNCILGGGNEAANAGAVRNIFEYNTLDTCAFESSDTGAFYTCGQQATAMVNPGNVVRHSTFTNVLNTGGSGVQGITIQAIYLDDQMSSWNIYNNSFINCTTGTFVGGGRLNNVSYNYYENVGTAHHFDNRGMGWQKPSFVNCSCHGKAPNNGCACDTGAITYEIEGPAGSAWKAEFGRLVGTVKDVNCGTNELGLIPCYNVVSNNQYCRTKTMCDASMSEVEAWHSSMVNNVEFCR